MAADVELEKEKAVAKLRKRTLHLLSGDATDSDWRAWAFCEVRRIRELYLHVRLDHDDAVCLNNARVNG